MAKIVVKSAWADRSFHSWAAWTCLINVIGYLMRLSSKEWHRRWAVNPLVVEDKRARMVLMLFTTFVIRMKSDLNLTTVKSRLASPVHLLFHLQIVLIFVFDAKKLNLLVDLQFFRVFSWTYHKQLLSRKVYCISDPTSLLIHSNHWLDVSLNICFVVKLLNLFQNNRPCVSLFLYFNFELIDLFNQNFLLLELLEVFRPEKWLDLHALDFSQLLWLKRNLTDWHDLLWHSPWPWILIFSRLRGPSTFQVWCVNGVFNLFNVDLHFFNFNAPHFRVKSSLCNFLLRYPILFLLIWIWVLSRYGIWTIQHWAFLETDNVGLLETLSALDVLALVSDLIGHR